MRDETMFELFYSDGGHGGPWIGERSAYDQARYHAMANEVTVSIRKYPHVTDASNLELYREVATVGPDGMIEVVKPHLS